MISNETITKEFLETAPWENLQGPLEAFADRLYKHRGLNRGFTPKPIFGACVGMGGVSVCVEVAYVVKDKATGNILGIAMKVRESNDAWNGLLSGTGAAVRPLEFESDALRRAIKEATDEEVDLKVLRRIGTTIHAEPERFSMCRSTIFVAEVSEEEVSQFNGAWEILKDYIDPRVINHHQQIARFIMGRMMGSEPRDEVNVCDYPVAAPEATPTEPAATEAVPANAS